MTPPLLVVKQFFGQLETEEIRYCLWKGSQHLQESLSGQSDLDLLVDQNQASRIKQILLELGYKRFISQPWASFPAIEDWIGYDDETGKLVHIHLYYQLLLGTKFVKEYHLPWEDLILDSAIKDSLFQVFIVDPHLEIILLSIRIGFKTSFLDLISGFSGQSPIEKGLSDNFNFLAERIDEDLVREYTRYLLGNESGQQFGAIITHGDMNKKEVLLQVRAIIDNTLGKYRRYDRASVLRIATWRKLQYLDAKARRKLNLNGQTGKRMKKEGAVIAIIGCDGSGKSTITKELEHWLAWKIDAHKIYLGSGDGSVDLSVKLLKALASNTSRKKTNHKTKRNNGLSSKNGRGKSSLFKETASCLLGLSITNQRYRKVKEMRQARTRGSILVADRYPQNQFVGIYDGPRVARKDTGSWVRKFFSKLEENKYQEMDKIPPDIVFKLNVPLEIALQRKPGHDSDEIRRKAEITGELGFPESKVIDIDASKPLMDVMGSIKKSVWESI